MYRDDNLCGQFGQILHGEAKVQHGGCSVGLRRDIAVTLYGRPTSTLMEVEIWFESLGTDGKALCFGEVAILQEEVPGFTSLLVRQGIPVSAIHNHWILTKPEVLYLHFQSVEPPLAFARKVAYAFTALKSYPVS